MQNIKISYQTVSVKETAFMNTIANWYYQEWNIPAERTIRHISSFGSGSVNLQILMQINAAPVATAGLYNKVGIFDVDPTLKRFKHWLALVYTVPGYRRKGYASLLCQHIELLARQRGITELYLFTHTAASLYHSLNWKVIKRIHHGTKHILIMEKKLGEISSNSLKRSLNNPGY